MTIQEQLTDIETLLVSFNPKIVYAKNSIDELLNIHKSDSNRNVYINFNSIDVEVFEDGGIDINTISNIYIISKALEKGISPDDLLNKLEGVLSSLKDVIVEDIDFDNHNGQYYFLDIKIKF